MTLPAVSTTAGSHTTAYLYLMIINGKHYRLTKHGRQRYRERVAPVTDDRIIIATAHAGLPDYKFIWLPDAKHADTWRLITVYYAPSHPHYKEE